MSFTSGNYDNIPYDYYQSGRPRPAGSLANDPRYPVQPIDPSYNANFNPNFNQHGSFNQNLDQRFNNYKRKNNDYKYNIYSLIDQPWNRLCEVGRCGTCPGN